MTKMYTAAALVSLAEEGKLDLNAPIGKYLSGLTPRLASVTAHQLMSHTAGLADGAEMIGNMMKALWPKRCAGTKIRCSSLIPVRSYRMPIPAL
jgi:CubicO group peptidase (beta-lactamase class C family)